jgi:hypothetical protein
MHPFIASKSRARLGILHRSQAVETLIVIRRLAKLLQGGTEREEAIRQRKDRQGKPLPCKCNGNPRCCRGLLVP